MTALHIPEVTDDMSMRDAALAYAAAGIGVLPVNPRTKEPMVSHGFKDATTAIAQIAIWWTRSPKAMIGARPPVDVMVLDVDVIGPEHPDAHGDQELSALEDRHDRLPSTWCAESASGGLHYWLHADLEGRRTAKNLAPGIDIKTHENGYIIVPPSRRNSGLQYRWLNTPAIADAPAWIIALAVKGPLPHTDAVTPRRPGCNCIGRMPAPCYWCAVLKREPTAEVSAVGNSTNSPLGGVGERDHTRKQLPTDTHRHKRSRPRGNPVYARAAILKELTKLANAVQGTRNDTLFATACSVFEFVKGGHAEEAGARAELLRIALAIGLTEGEIVGDTGDGGTLGSAWRKAQPRSVPAPGPRFNVTEVTHAAFAPTKVSQ